MMIMEAKPELDTVPVIVEQLTGAGVAKGAAYSAENVIVASSMGEFLKGEMGEVAKVLEADENMRSEAEKALAEKRSKAAEVVNKIVELEDKKLFVESLVAEGERLIAEDNKLIAAVSEEQAKLARELEIKKETIEAERSLALAKADLEGPEKRAELKVVVETRPEAVAGRGLKQDLALVEKLNAVVGDQNLANALERLATDLGGADLAAGLEKARARTEAVQKSRDELAVAVREERERIAGDIEAKKAGAELKAKDELNAAEAEYQQKTETLKQRETHYSQRLAEHGGLRGKHEAERVKTDDELSQARVELGGLDKDIKADEVKILSLERVITAQNGLMAKLAEGITANVEQLSTRGREIIDILQVAVTNLSESFDREVEGKLVAIVASEMSRFELFDKEVVGRRDNLRKAKKEAMSRATGRLVDTGLYKLGEDGEVEQVQVRGLENILKARQGQSEADSALAALEASLEKVSTADDLISQREANETAAIIRERDEKEDALRAGADAERLRFTAALASMEVIAATLPAAETVAANPTQPWYREPVKAIGGLLGRLFRR